MVDSFFGFQIFRGSLLSVSSPIFASKASFLHVFRALHFFLCHHSRVCDFSIPSHRFLLKTLKKNCIIINAARGGIINEEDLNKALNEDLIFGAGLDVFETEPPENNNPLLKNEKVFLSPHTAAFTEECMIRMGKETTQNIIDFFEKKLEKSKIVTL